MTKYNRSSFFNLFGRIKDIYRKAPTVKRGPRTHILNLLKILQGADKKAFIVTKLGFRYDFAGLSQIL